MTFAPVSLAGRAGGVGVVLACEHASAAMPPEYGNLGLSIDQVSAHIGWDIGAAHVTTELAFRLGAPAVLSAVSRLLVDCNRDESDHDLIPGESHGVAIPGNAGISDRERASRLARFYDPYHAALDAAVAASPDFLLLSVHSFTPTLNGETREFDVGVLFDAFEDLAEDLASRLAAARFAVRLNQPYSGLDGLIYSARRHGNRRRVRYLELEINNRLLRQPSGILDVVQRLLDPITAIAEDGRSSLRIGAASHRE